jgi:hypothetical protein
MISVAADSTAVSKDARVYEMRVYYAPPGRLNDLHKRFRDHTLRLFEKHGIESIGYWVPMGENKEEKLVYILGYPSREAREKSWKEFFADPDWKRAFEESHRNGEIVIGDKIQSVFMQPTDYSPTPRPEIVPGSRVFEFRTYTTPPGKLDALNARFRNHTLKLFEKHGIKNFAYFLKMRDQKDADNTLFYILAHKDKEAGAASFKSFREDPAWIAAKTESEKNGSLTMPNGVKSEYYVATDYSPTR